MSNKRDERNNLDGVIQANRYEDGEVFRICPKCGEEKNLFDFGFRFQNGKVWNQSECKDCR